MLTSAGLKRYGTFRDAHRLRAAARRRLLRRAPDLAVLTGGLGLTLFAPFDGPWWLLALRVSAGGVFAAGTVGTWRRERDRRALQTEVDRLVEQECVLRAEIADQTRQFRDTVKGVLALLSIERLGFTRDERISLYSHQASRFVLLERFSLHPEYTRRPRRAFYGEDEGCLAMAWREGRCVVCFTPDPVREPRRYAREHVRTWNMPEVAADAAGMPIRELAAFALLDATGRRNVGVAVFESCRGDGLPLAEICRYMESPESRQLAEFAGSDRAPDIGMSMREEL